MMNCQSKAPQGRRDRRSKWSADIGIVASMDDSRTNLRIMREAQESLLAIADIREINQTSEAAPTDAGR